MNAILKYRRRRTDEVRIGSVTVGGNNPIAVQSMTNTPTADTEASVAQTERIARAGASIVRLTAQGRREAENLEHIVARLRSDGFDTAIVADIHFVPEMAMTAARFVDKVRINPGNFRTSGGEFQSLISLCRQRGAAIRVGVNHGSLAKHIFDRYGDTPEGMVASAMEFLAICQAENFHNVVVSMKSSNTRVMVYAYRLLVKAMSEAGMRYPLHLGVTEAGDGLEARIKSAVGTGALLADGLGDTIRVSLTEAPENEVPVGELLVSHFANRKSEITANNATQISPFTQYVKRSHVAMPLVHDEIPDNWRIIRASSDNPTAELRSAILDLATDEPIAVACTYNDADFTTAAIKAAADLGALFIDGLADGIIIDAPQFTDGQRREAELAILQAARVRMSRTEYIACPSCGRTLYDIEKALAEIKARTSHLKNLKIGVMGCIVNGPGEMADADYGYVGAAAGRITLYRGREIIEKNIPQDEALDRLVALIKADGRWTEPENTR